MKKFKFFIILCGVACAATTNAQTWNCGDPNINGGADVTATFSGSTLTISGTGDMENYGSGAGCPWYDVRGSIETVNINNGVTSIGENAFSGSSLTEVTIPNSVITIGAYAFQYCDRLTEVTIPNSVTALGWWTFGFCSSLTELTIGNSLTFIDNFAFANCSSLEEVTIPNSVTGIGWGAFGGCSSLIEVTIPSSVTGIDQNNFNGCSSLTAINVDAGNSVYSSVDGVLFNKDKTTLLRYPCAKQGGYTIPGTVTAIGDAAFNDCIDLAAVSIPNTVTTIGSGAFNGCINLEEVTIGNSVETIGSVAFGGCSKLIEVNIPNSVTSIGHDAFRLCSSLSVVTIPNSVTTIEEAAFYGCNLDEVSIPYSVKFIGNQPFANCGNLNAINVDAENSEYSSVDGILFNKNQTILVQYPGGKQGGYSIPGSVTYIELLAFHGCRSLTEVTVPSSVINFGNRVFLDCSVTEITNHASAPQQIENNVFEHIDISQITLRVPAGAISAYKAANVWKEFIIEPIPIDINITTQPASATDVTAGSISVNLTVAAVATQSGALLSYHWYESTEDNNTGGEEIAGATGATFAIPAALEGGTYYYFCELRDASVYEASAVRSQVATLNVTPLDIAITSQPAALSKMPIGGVAGELTVKAFEANDAEIVYQWFVAAEPDNTGGTAIEGVTDGYFEIPTDLAVGTYYYYCVVSAPGGACAVHSDVATLIVYEVVVDFPFFEGFEDVAFPPPHWLSYNVDEGGTQWLISTARSFDGLASAVHSLSASGVQEGWLVAPALSIPATGYYELTFRSYNQYPTDNVYNGVWISTEDFDPSTSTFIEIKKLTGSSEISASWKEIVIPLSEYAGQTVFIAFKYMGQSADNWFIDDVEVSLSSKPVITFSVHPQPTTSVVEGGITGSLTVSASVTSGDTPSYQWYEAATASNTTGAAIVGATGASFTIPVGLTIGTYYYFCEASADDALSVRSNPATVVVADIQPEIFTVTFNTQDGKPSQEKTTESGSAITAPPEPTRTGYTFGGWYRETGCVNIWNFATDIVTGDVTLYAKWTTLITFNTHPAANTNVTAGGITGSLTVAASVTSGDTPAYQWYEAPTASNTTGTPIVGATGANFAIPVGLTAGTYYYFCEASAANASSVRSDVATVVVADNVETFTVTFNTQDGSPSQRITVPSGSKISQPPAPTRTGYTFDGWYREPGYVNIWDFANGIVTADITLYAKWTFVTKAEDFVTAELFIYPNPFTDDVRITGATTGVTRGHAPLLKVIDASGAAVHTQILSSADETLHLEHLPPGVYFILFEKGGKTVKTVKIIKE